MSSLIELPEPLPVLRNPFLVMHLGGWSDAGLAGEGAAVFLGARWKARTLATFDADELLDYRARRPVVRLTDGVIEELTWSSIELSVAETDGPRDVVLLTGPEPDFRWQAFTREVVRACRALRITEAFGLGGFPAPSVHTEPVQILGSSVDPHLAARLDTVSAVVELSGGVQTVLEQRLHEGGIPAMGIWARIPPYLAGGAHPPATLALIRTLILLSGLEVDTTDLETAAKDHLEQVEQAIQERPQIARFVEQLRAVADEEDTEVPSGEEIAAELERFLSQQPPPDQDDQG
jgi:proteasome assembly chaperone (PAC2) family protein